MTAFERVRRTQRSLSLVVGSSALFWAAAVLFGVLVLGALLGALVAMPPALRLSIRAFAFLASLGTLGFMLWRGRFAWKSDRVALWIEERAPELRYALVTAIDPRYSASMGPLMEPIVSKVDTAPFVRDAAVRTTLPSMAALLVAALAFGFMPTKWKTALGAGNLMNFGAKAPAIMGNRLVPLNATVTSPAYSNIAQQKLTNPSTITGLRGTKVLLEGNGPTEGLTAVLQLNDTVQKTVPITGDGDAWHISLALTDSLPLLLKLRDEHPSRKQVYPKLIVIDPRVDQAPVAKLLSPVKDTTLRDIVGNLTLSSDLTDDVGITRGFFEILVSKMTESDKAEVTRTEIDARSFGGARSGHLGATIPMKSLNLTEGALITIRSLAIDNNTLYGPDTGFSETRTIRIATKAEYDSLNVNPAPPSADTAMQTLRMLIIAVEKLDKARPTMERKKFVDSSFKLAGHAEIVKQKVQKILDDQTGGGEVEANPLLTTALNEMYEATRSLMIAETGESLPHLYAAYKALEQYRKAKKYYLRGRIQVEPVNIDRVRGQGKDSAKASPRMARGVEAADREKYAADYAKAVRGMKESPESSIETLTLLRVQSMRKYPDLAKALEDAVNAMQEKKDPTAALGRARRVIDGNMNVLSSLPVWSGAW